MAFSLFSQLLVFFGLLLSGLKEERFLFELKKSAIDSLTLTYCKVIPSLSNGSKNGKKKKKKAALFSLHHHINEYSFLIPLF